MLERLFLIEGGMDSSKHHKSAAFANCAADCIASQSVARVDANSDDIAFLDSLQIQLL